MSDLAATGLGVAPQTAFRVLVVDDDCEMAALLGRDRECLEDIGRTLELEPRHFAAMMHFGEILLGAGAPLEARFAFYAALTIHPHLPRARAALADKA